MANALRKIKRGIDRRAIKQLYAQVFFNRQLWEEFELELAKLPEDERPKDATIGLHALVGNWLQGRRDAKRRPSGGLIQVAGTMPGDAPGELARKLRAEHGQSETA